MANRKYGGRTWSPEDDFKVTTGKPWEAAGDRASDDTGATRGAQSEGADDKSFLRPSQSRTDHGEGSPPDWYKLIDNQVDQPAGPLLGGGGPVSKNVEGGPPRYKSNAGRKPIDDGSL